MTRLIPRPNATTRRVWFRHSSHHLQIKFSSLYPLHQLGRANFRGAKSTIIVWINCPTFWSVGFNPEVPQTPLAQCLSSRLRSHTCSCRSCMHGRVCACMDVCAHVWTCVHECVCACMSVCTCMDVCACTCASTARGSRLRITCRSVCDRDQESW